MTDKELIQQLESQLKDQVEQNAELISGLQRVFEKQSRDRKVNSVKFALEVDGELRHESDSWEAVMQAKDFYDDAQVVTWTETPKQYVSASEEEKVEGN